MKVLLFGATGNLGSRLVPALLSHKHQVVVYVRSEQKLKQLLPSTLLSRITIVTGDATDANAIKDALVDNKSDALVNSAGLASIFPWEAPKQQEIEHAVTTAAVNASKQLEYPIRAWFLGGMTALDVSTLPGTPIVRYFPMFTEHVHTYALLQAKPLENLQWSMLCPSVMEPASKTIDVDTTTTGANSLVAAADVPPNFLGTYLMWLPVLGPLFHVLRNGLRYNIKLEDAADFIAADLEQPGSKFVGHRVGLIEMGIEKAK